MTLGKAAGCELLNTDFTSILNMSIQQVTEITYTEGNTVQPQ